MIQKENLCTIFIYYDSLQHLKVARKLMGLLKLITVEPEHPHELGNEDISSPPVENSGPDNSVVNRSDDGNISPSGYEGKDRVVDCRGRII